LALDQGIVTGFVAPLKKALAPLQKDEFDAPGADVKAGADQGYLLTSSLLQHL